MDRKTPVACGAVTRVRLGSWLVAAAMLLSFSGCSAKPANSPALTQADFGLINRLTWGANARDVEDFMRLGRAGWLKQQLRPGSDLHLPEAVAATYASLELPKPIGATVVALDKVRYTAVHTKDQAEKTRIYADFAQPVRDYRQRTETRSFMRDLYSPDQLREQLTWFWFNHFNVRGASGSLAVLVNDYEEQTIRPRALGKFCDLVNATLRHPAMLIYLGNAANTNAKGNENYARELMELHTMGVGSGYTQADVQQLAKVLTGATIDLSRWPPGPAPHGGARDGLFVFDPSRHDDSARKLLGQTLHARGYAQIDEATGILCHQPATARHIVTKLAKYFVADDPPATLVEPLVKVFQDTDGDITAVMTAMIAAPEFTASLGTLFKDPQHFALSAVRLAFPDQPIGDIRALSAMMGHLGQPLFTRITPDGYPLESPNWNATGQLATRFYIAKQIGGGAAQLMSAPGQIERSRAAPDLKAMVATTGIYARLAPATQGVLDEARNASEWNSLFLSSPEFMHR